MAAPRNLTVLRRTFVDICRGYSTAVYEGKVLYIRHLSHMDHVMYDEVQAGYEQRARDEGALSEADKLAQLKAAGRWSDAKDAEITRQRDTIKRFEDTIRNTPQPSVVASLSGQLEGEKAKLMALVREKVEMLGMTVEVYSNRLLNDHYVVTNLFKDPALTCPLFETASFDQMPDDQVEALLEVYHQAIEPLGDRYLRELAVQEFFTSYWGAANDDAHGFYGKPVSQLTYYQIQLISMARYFRSILEGTDMSRMPSEMRGDPDAIEKLYHSQKALEQQKAEGKLPGNMTEADIKQTGLEGSYTPVTKAESGLDIAKRLAAAHRRAQ